MDGLREETLLVAPSLCPWTKQLKAWILEKVVTPPETSGSGSSTSTTVSSSSESGEPSRTAASRRRKGSYFPHELSWAFRQETETHTILTWHIATWICSTRTVHEVLSSSDYMAATKLSSYCAYLVAFHPDLLPGHHRVARRMSHTRSKATFGRRDINLWKVHQIHLGLGKRQAISSRGP